MTTLIGFKVFFFSLMRALNYFITLSSSYRLSVSLFTSGNFIAGKGQTTFSKLGSPMLPTELPNPYPASVLL